MEFARYDPKVVQLNADAAAPGVLLVNDRFHPDWKVWVDCSYETALERALQRGQEGLPPDETIRAYRTIYFPAQEIHLRLDDPRTTADAVMINDLRLVPNR